MKLIYMGQDKEKIAFSRVEKAKCLSLLKILQMDWLSSIKYIVQSITDIQGHYFRINSLPVFHYNIKIQNNKC